MSRRVPPLVVQASYDFHELGIWPPGAVRTPPAGGAVSRAAKRRFLRLKAHLLFLFLAIPPARRERDGPSKENKRRIKHGIN